MASKSADNGQQSIEVLQQRYAGLSKKKIEAETELRGAQRRLEELQGQAREKYGTDDVAKLQELLDKMKAENEDKRAAYQADLDRIENQLAEVEKNFAAAQSPAIDQAIP
jgi:chromosome segregation ATPase